MRRRIAELVAVTTLGVLLLTLVPVGALLRSEAAANATAIGLLKAQATADLVAGIGPAAVQADGRTTVFHADGRVTGTGAERSASVQLAVREGESIVVDTDGGREILVPVSSSRGTDIVRVLVPDAELRAGVTRGWLVLAVAGLILLVLAVGVADQLARRVIRPVADLAGTAGRLSAGDLTARVSPSGPPEIRQVGSELNRLAGRIEELLTATRAEAADLAHRLRTPLTALRLDTGGLTDPREATRLSAGVDRITAEVDELIRTTRRPIRAGSTAGADLAAVGRDRLHFWSALADDAGRRLTGEFPTGTVPVRISATDLAAMFDVLLDNAFRHTPDGTEIRIGVNADRRAWIDDAGPGMPPAGTDTGTTGTGLGLDIAHRTARSAGGSLRLEPSPLGGLRVVFDAGAAETQEELRTDG